MPLTRYQIRNEFSLADPELYRAAEKDDPEALLEGVAMAGLVGVLRQLGDLAEFAAEIFHDLHEEVMATASRGHGLMARVQQLEAEFPCIEKAILSQTNHSLFFANAGFDWHPNMRAEQNLITRGDLPRCVMDSYEECRGPPRLFLLDKFDVAGAGACLKRYTDPAFFKVEMASSRVAPVVVQREKKTRKVKKKGSRWRNGETPEVAPTSHAKLHQLFLEESIENAYSDPARVVKLKRRQLNGSPFNSKSGKSYMEKFLQTPSPEHKSVYETSVALPALQLTPENASESALEILDINTVSPVKKTSLGVESSCSSPNLQETVQKPSSPELNGEVIDREIVKVPEPRVDDVKHEILSTFHEAIVERQLVVIGDSREQYNLDGDHSDDVASEVDNYLDALATIESELETDNEWRAKKGNDSCAIGKLGIYADANEGHLEVQAPSSDSHSAQSYAASDGGNSSFKRERSSFSYSDTESSLAENMHSDGEGANIVLPSNENDLASVMQLGSSSSEVSFFKAVLSNKDRQPNKEEESSVSYHTVSNPNFTPVNNNGCSVAAMHVDPILDEEVSDKAICASEITKIDKNGRDLYNSEQRDDTLLPVSAENHLKEEYDDGNTTIPPDALLDSPNISALPSERKHTDDHLDELLQKDNTERVSNGKSIDDTVALPNFIISPTEVELPCSTLPHAETSQPGSSDVLKPVNIASEDCEDAEGREAGEYAATFDMFQGVIVSGCQDNSVPEIHYGIGDSKTETVQAEGQASPGAVDLCYKKSEFEEVISQESHSDTEVQKNMNQVEVALTEVGMPTDQFNEGSLQVVESSESSSNPMPQQTQSLVPMEQESVHTPAEHFLVQSSSQHLQLGILPPSIDPELDSNKLDMGLPNPALQSFGLINKATQVNGEATPPLPPLPPMQWRMGKLHHPFPASEGELAENEQGSFPILLQNTAEPEDLHLEDGMMHPGNPFLSCTLEDKESDQVFEKSMTDLVQPTPSSMQLPMIVSDADCQYEGIIVKEIKSSNPFITTPEICEERPECGSVTREDEMLQSCNPFIAASAVEHVVSGPVPVSSYEKLTEPAEEQVQNADLEVVAFRPTMQNLENPSDLSASLPTEIEEQHPNVIEEKPPAEVKEQLPAMVEEHHQTPAATALSGQTEPSTVFAQNALSISEIVATWPTNAFAQLPNVEVGNENGNPTVKLPRPRNPLIDAVAAHDKSKLRKVAERVRPQTMPKTDERDSLLEQIRTKSFSLKPAVLTRPSIHAPKTNLKVAAILEKANAIRQACAGSDEDEDEDWSDS